MKYGEVDHFSHPEHKLYFVHSDVPFKCDGCHQVGIGSRFNCALCDFDLHTDCADVNPNASALRHSFYPKCYFQFLPYPPGDCSRYCNACGQNIAGFVYHCRKCGNDLHPYCAALPHVLNANSGLRLHLHHKTSAPCDKCGWKGKTWCYRSHCKKFNLHVACAIKLWLDNYNELHYGRGDSNGDLISDGMTMVLRNKFPIIQAEGNNHHRRSWIGKLKKCSKLAVLLVKFIIAAMLGDPTTLIAGVITTLLSE